MPRKSLVARGPHWASSGPGERCPAGFERAVEHVAVGEMLDEQAPPGRASSRRSDFPGRVGRFPRSVGGHDLSNTRRRRPGIEVAHLIGRVQRSGPAGPTAREVW